MGHKKFAFGFQHKYSRKLFSFDDFSCFFIFVYLNSFFESDFAYQK